MSSKDLKMSARSSALINLARLVLWLKTWSGYSTLKVKLCGIPFIRDLLFGLELETILDRTAGKKAFSPKKKGIPPRKKLNLFRWCSGPDYMFAAFSGTFFRNGRIRSH